MFNYKWNLSDGYPEQNGLKVFSTFSCGGGSSMGYKLAGYEVIGANDIDPQMAKVYQENHHPKYFFLCPIKDLITKDLPEELFNLDILDGSPPCSTFSMAGSREKAWGKDKMFREGQAKQVLDDLFFDFIDLVDRLKPKVVIAENVKGMLAGNAKGYLIEIKKRLVELGYEVQIFCLNGATMGLPQRRERVFVICNRMKYPKLKLEFNEKPIRYKEIAVYNGKKLNKFNQELWDGKNTNDSGLWDTKKRMGIKPSDFNCRYLKENEVCPTLGAGTRMINFFHPSYVSKESIKLMGSFPKDYAFLDIEPRYLIGMSVPPVMMAQVSNQVYLQWLKK